MNLARFAKTLFLLLLAAQVPLASATVTYYVGGCEGGSHFTTITAALAATPAPDLVLVCPGTYPEQIQITNSVTLQGINPLLGAGQVVITVPSGGLLPGNPCTRGVVQGGLTVLPQVCVSLPLFEPGAVNITNITVDGSGGTGNTGIAYLDSNGTVNHVEAKFQQSDGILMAAVQASPLVAVEDSNVHSFGHIGINVQDVTGQGSSMGASISGNTVMPSATAVAGIFANSGEGWTITRNIIDGPATPTCPTTGGTNAPRCGGIVAITEVGTLGYIQNNTVVGIGSGGAGIFITDALLPGYSVTVSSNTVFNIAGDGIRLGGPFADNDPLITANIIMQAQNGINFQCNVDNNVSSNTISAIHNYGLANVPTAVSSLNAYYNVPNARSTCP